MLLRFALSAGMSRSGVMPKPSQVFRRLDVALLTSPLMAACRLTLEELYNGCTKMRKLTRKVRAEQRVADSWKRRERVPLIRSVEVDSLSSSQVCDQSTGRMGEASEVLKINVRSASPGTALHATTGVAPNPKLSV